TIAIPERFLRKEHSPSAGPSRPPPAYRQRLGRQPELVPAAQPDPAAEDVVAAALDCLEHAAVGARHHEIHGSSRRVEQRGEWPGRLVKLMRPFDLEAHERLELRVAATLPQSLFAV